MLTSMEVLCGELMTTTNLLREATPAGSGAMPCVCFGIGSSGLLHHVDLGP